MLVFLLALNLTENEMYEVMAAFDQHLELLTRVRILERKESRK